MSMDHSHLKEAYMKLKWVLQFLTDINSQARSREIRQLLRVRICERRLEAFNNTKSSMVEVLSSIQCIWRSSLAIQTVYSTTYQTSIHRSMPLVIPFRTLNRLNTEHRLREGIATQLVVLKGISAIKAMASVLQSSQSWALSPLMRGTWTINELSQRTLTLRIKKEVRRAVTSLHQQTCQNCLREIIRRVRAWRLTWSRTRAQVARIRARQLPCQQ